MILFLLLCVLSSIQGIRDGILFSLKGAEAFKWNEHIVLLGERIIIGVCLITANYTNINNLGGIIAAWVFVYSFFHNGFYYETRRAIDVPYYKFTSNSISSTARFEIKWRARLALFILGLVIAILTIYL